jgi:hypothetical protein
MFYFYATIWYLIGVAGCILPTWLELKQGQDFTLADLILMIIFSITGPVIAVVGVWYYFIKAEPHVLIKGKKK